MAPTRINRTTLRLICILIALFTLAPLWLPASLQADDASTPTYERDIKPLFTRRCTICHKASKRNDPDVSGGLALDSYEAIFDGTPRERVIVPKRSDLSELIRRLAERDPDRRMPQDDEPLPQSQQDLVRRWIDSGAPRGAASPKAPNRQAALHPSATTGRRAIRFVRSLDVALPCNVKLAPGTALAPKGGSLSITLRIGPLPPVTALALRGDDRLLAVGTYGQVVLWDLREGRPAGALCGIPGTVHALAFFPDGRRLAIGGGLAGRSGFVRVYTVPDGTLIHDFPGHEDVVFGMALRPDGAQLATASFDQTVRLWDLASGRPGGVFRGHSDFVYSVVYTPDSSAILTGSKDRTIKRINIRTLKEERTFSGYNEDVLALAVHPDGKRFVSAGIEPQLRWWALDGDKPQARRNGHAGLVSQLAFSRDGQRLVSSGSDGSVRIWNGQTGEPIRQFRGGDWIYAVAISDNGAFAAGGGWDGIVRVWDTAADRLRAALVQPPADSDFSDPCPVPWFAITPNGQVAGSPDLVRIAEWKADAVKLPQDAARAICCHPEAVAQSLRGEPVKPVIFPTKK